MFLVGWCSRPCFSQKRINLSLEIWISNNLKVHNTYYNNMVCYINNKQSDTDSHQSKVNNQQQQKQNKNIFLASGESRSAHSKKCPKSPVSACRGAERRWDLFVEILNPNSRLELRFKKNHSGSWWLLLSLQASAMLVRNWNGSLVNHLLKWRRVLYVFDSFEDWVALCSQCFAKGSKIIPNFFLLQAMVGWYI